MQTTSDLKNYGIEIKTKIETGEGKWKIKLKSLLQNYYIL